MKKLVFIFILLLLIGCARPLYIPVESIRTEYKDHYHRDSIYLKDSIYIREKGDTVFETHWRTEYRDRLKTDSILIRDSIQVPYPVERKLNRWERLKMDVGGVSIGILILLGIYGIWKIRKKIKNRFKASR